MKVVFAPDSFKGSLSADAAARAMAAGWRRVFPQTECVLLPVADGGEGTRSALVTATGGRNIAQTITDALGERREACWGLLGKGETAVVELADAAGLTQVPPERRDPKRTTTYGVGELLLAAVRHPGVRTVIVGLGGSATNDGGAGLLTALGVRLRDGAGCDLPPGGASLIDLASVDFSELRLDPASVDVRIACDVDHPLTGPHGASAIFGPQKGATPDDIVLLDAALARFASVLGIDPVRPGSGAAGGAAAGLLRLFPNAVLLPGIRLVLEAVGFERHLVGATLALTGEGRLDGQTLGGKAVAGVGNRARAAGVPTAALVGGITGEIDPARLASEAGVDAVLPIVPGPCTLEEALRNAEPWLSDAAERAARWIGLGRNGVFADMAGRAGNPVEHDEITGR
ncbi:MAG: glycerate kinase [Capsulimonadales bacterium]|nr:glycerate kinase [Capsulimonadales bacterium]